MGCVGPKQPFRVVDAMEPTVGLREMAKMIGVSPTYLSKVERDENAVRRDEEPEQSDRGEEVKAVKQCERGYSATCELSPETSSKNG